jgi:ArsR family transcriptional regulator, virulence genes transcriptional regulator
MPADPDADPLDRYRLHASICKVLTDPKRLLLLAALRNGDRTVGELAATIGTSLPNASQHLAVLRSAGLVDGRREGAAVRYRLAEPAILDACDIVDRIVERRLARRAAGRPAATANSAKSANSAASAPAVPAG